VDGKDPEERMIRVLRWYLSSFHAGRKSAVAKKPYNPILVRAKPAANVIKYSLLGGIPPAGCQLIKYI
jgi:hypothetical protein